MMLAWSVIDSDCVGNNREGVVENLELEAHIPSRWILEKFLWL